MGEPLKRAHFLVTGAVAVLAAAVWWFTSTSVSLPEKSGNDRAPGHEKMVGVLRDVDRASEDFPLLGDRLVRDLRQRIASLPPDAPPDRHCAFGYALGMAELELGREKEAIDLLTRAYEILTTLPGNPASEDRLKLIFELGVACMRLGETQNCCLRHNPDSCLLPIRGGGIHTNREGSSKAIRYFEEVLSKTSGDLGLKARWLLNIAYMTLGEYPDRVPREYLIPPRAFESEAPFPRFRNIASRVGLDTFSLCGGAVADDFDNDGYIDLTVSSFDMGEPVRYFHNNRDGTFSEQTEQAGLTGITGGLNLVQGDYDNDGNVDILVLRGAWFRNHGHIPNSLLRNRGDGSFEDITFAAGLGEVHYPTQTASWADYDNDGDLDLYVGNESTEEVRAPCQLFRNNGNGTFIDVARKAGVTNDLLAKGVIWGDYNGDRFPDIYVANLNGPNRLYRNNQDGGFTDIAAAVGVTRPLAAFPCWFWDFDNDGNLDLLAMPYRGDISHTAAAALGLPVRAELPQLYRSDGKGGFVEVSHESNLKSPVLPMGSNFGDVDGDGYLDFYLGTGDPDYMNLMPNLMYHNQEGKRFADVTTNGGFGNLQKGHAIAFADFDNDGDQDVFAQMGGFYRGDRYNDSLYENPGFGNRWIAIKLIGVHSNRSAIGSRIRVVVIEQDKERTIYRHVNSGGTFGGNPLRQHIGLGKADRIVALEIAWPTTGKTQKFENVALDQYIEITEGKAAYRVVSLKKLTLGGSSKR
jgi:hypothetical protein